jgi:hypothetical protein
MAKALQDCPTSGLLWAECISMAMQVQAVNTQWTLTGHSLDIQ